ncbi:hypothetical protein RI367_006000 [Sorochytrium milnesiophthora]
MKFTAMPYRPWDLVLAVREEHMREKALRNTKPSWRTFYKRCVAKLTKPRQPSRTTSVDSLKYKGTLKSAPSRILVRSASTFDFPFNTPTSVECAASRGEDAAIATAVTQDAAFNLAATASSIATEPTALYRVDAQHSLVLTSASHDDTAPPALTRWCGQRSLFAEPASRMEDSSSLLALTSFEAPLADAAPQHYGVAPATALSPPTPLQEMREMPVLDEVDQMFANDPNITENTRIADFYNMSHYMEESESCRSIDKPDTCFTTFLGAFDLSAVVTSTGALVLDEAAAAATMTATSEPTLAQQSTGTGSADDVSMSRSPLPSAPVSDGSLPADAHLAPLEHQSTCSGSSTPTVVSATSHPSTLLAPTAGPLAAFKMVNRAIVGFFNSRTASAGMQN